MATVAYANVEIAPDGTPMIAGTSTKVVEVVLDRLAHHWDADEIRRQHPSLSLGQIHGALAYYYDHQDELDHMIADRSRIADALLEQIGESPLMAKLRAIKSGRSTP